jgi:hypothetical protein
VGINTSRRISTYCTPVIRPLISTSSPGPMELIHSQEFKLIFPLARFWRILTSTYLSLSFRHRIFRPSFLARCCSSFCLKHSTFLLARRDIEHVYQISLIKARSGLEQGSKVATPCFSTLLPFLYFLHRFYIILNYVLGRYLVET